MLPTELQSLLDQVDACEREAERLLADMDDESINRAAPDGGWGVAQCLDHLALMNEFYLRDWHDAVRAAVSSRRGPFAGLKPTFIGAWFAKSLEPPVKMKAKAIAAVRPGARFTRDEILRRYKASHDGYRDLVRSAAAVDVNRIVGRNAIVRRVKMRLSTVLLVIPAHDRRHLWQAKNAKAAYR